MATRREIFRALTEAGAELYGEAEARQIAEMVLESRGVSRNMLLVEPNEELQFPDLDSVINDIRAWRPVQYIIGTADIVVRVAIKPTPSIAREQQTFDFESGRVAPLTIGGRHDACIARRGAVVVEAVVALALADLKLRR